MINLNNITKVKNKTMYFNTPLFNGDIALRDYVQKLAQKEDKSVLIVTDGMIIYENMPDDNVRVLSLKELSEMDWNEEMIFELQDYLEKDGVILIRIYDDVIEVSVEDAINYLYAKTRGLFIIQLSNDIDNDLKHHHEVDLGEFLWSNTIE